MSDAARKDLPAGTGGGEPMISHASRCIFIHQRKSASSAVKALFPDAVGEDRRLFRDGLLSPEWTADRDLVARYYKFTVVRNPWDRLVSGWKYCNMSRKRSLKDVLRHPPRLRLAEGVTDRQASVASRKAHATALMRHSFVECRNTVLSSVLRQPRRKPHDPGHDYRHLTRPQCATIVDPGGALIVDKVVFFEDLEGGLAEVFDAIGRPLPQVPRLNVRRSGDDYRRYFDDEALGLFDRRFGGDVARWGYDFHSGLPRELRGARDPEIPMIQPGRNR